MRWTKNNRFYQLRLWPGEEIITSLVEFSRRVKIKSGVVLGIGAGTNFELGYYHFDKQTYHRRRLKGEYEIVSLVGNIAWEDKQPICHCHIVLSDQRMATYGGHLFAGLVSATCEITVLPGDKKLHRELERETGLKLLKL
ncbi:DNA-binding protein [candidate division WOR-3 bacterium]|nr:DNA-binding protein [candidate division WOR-3 bacterium]